MLQFKKVARARITDHKVVNLMNFVILLDRKIEGGSKKKEMDSHTIFSLVDCGIETEAMENCHVCLYTI